MSKLRGFILFLAIVTAVFMALSAWLYQHRVTLTGFNDGPPLIWAHRGGGGRSGFAENSREALQNAIAQGLTGAELDVFYDRDLGDIVLSHDKPYSKPGGQILLLSDIAVPDHFRLWLDAKNLDGLSMDDIQGFAAILKKLDLQDQVLVESPSLSSLLVLDRYGIKTMFWAYADADRSPLYYLVIKAATWLGGIDMVSVSIDNLGYLHPHFARASLASFTLNSTESLCQAATSNAAHILLSGLTPDQLTLPDCP